jgi:hypothetical protein
MGGNKWDPLSQRAHGIRPGEEDEDGNIDLPQISGGLGQPQVRAEVSGSEALQIRAPSRAPRSELPPIPRI